MLVDGNSGVSVAESTIVIEYLDRFGDAPPLIPGGSEAALQARLWDRVMDGHVHTPMQKIVHDNLRPEGSGDPHGVEEAKAKLDQVYELLDDHLRDDDRDWLAGSTFTLADCSSAPALYYARVVHRWQHLSHLTRYFNALVGRPAVARVIDEARPFRQFLPLAWPDYAN